MEAYKPWADAVGRQLLNFAANTELFDDSGKAIKPLPTQGWFLTDFASAFAISAIYFALVIVGRIVMIPFRSLDKLTYPIRFVYNILQVMLCSYMTLEAGILAYRHNYNLVPCNPFKTENPPIAPVLWLFYISKVLDFMDTFFIVLGKKWEQLSFLHVYHHLTIFMIYWMNVNVGYDGDIYLTIVLNGFIHTVMYTYYFVSMHTKDIWWKKYLTMMQMIQFITMNGQAIWLLQSNCQTFPRKVTQLYLVYIMSLFALFLNFFIRSYVSPKSKKAKKH
ncbi:hypothetical protein GUITHDRAFT_98336 [Guillardia theta CCMP2712]|uniref:Elongation of fatty acids protein n=2 Tax=Guillardia theta TaxID=55529 RepID=L1IAX0_GUITC|nr:hypothetical protein GUITHDRAFT_98336 [Guillardia theta CCMP2712]EKX33396.1 hypothetical protein GUITHDRAFT_98336 [Guillardia theta CCMP2712]|eukprot:XP_005820376.1 hypothetical protein GUITHDRAFT_98336 [Guillardia theta CCMP2712]